MRKEGIVTGIVGDVTQRSLPQRWLEFGAEWLIKATESRRI